MQLAMEISQYGEIDDISVNIQTSQKVIDDNLNYKCKNHKMDRIIFVPFQEQYSAQVSNINIGFRGDNEPQHSYRLFVTTFLGYGANEALARHQRSLLFTQIPSKLSDKSW